MMKRIRKSLAVAVTVALLAATPAGAAPYYFWWQVIDERGEAYTGQNVNCSVFRPNTHAAILLHTTAGLSAGGNSPIFSDTSGKLHFWSTATDPVDVTCYYDNGGSAQINKLDLYTHKIVIPRQQGNKISRFSVNSVTANYQQDSGITIPQGGLIQDVIIQNLAPAAVGTYHLSVGFLGNHAVGVSNALVNAVSLSSTAATGGSSAEWIRPTLVGPSALSTHRGTAMSYAHVSGTFYFEKPYLVHVAEGLSVSFSAQPGTTAAVRAHVFILWRSFHTGINRLGLTN